MEALIPILVALVLIVLAWKLLKGVAKTGVLLAILVIAVAPMRSSWSQKPATVCAGVLAGLLTF